MVRIYTDADIYPDAVNVYSVGSKSNNIAHNEMGDKNVQVGVSSIMRLPDRPALRAANRRNNPGDRTIIQPSAVSDGCKHVCVFNQSHQ